MLSCVCWATSALSPSQILAIQAALAGASTAAGGGGAALAHQSEATVSLLGRTVPLQKHIGVFITVSFLNPARAATATPPDALPLPLQMNPGYAGRSALPDNLKALFRPCAMVSPDRSLISQVRPRAEPRRCRLTTLLGIREGHPPPTPLCPSPLFMQVLLYTLGFAHAEALARRAGTLFEACAEQLSRQGHYDWGLRALKTVLVAAGRVRRASLAQATSAGSLFGDEAGGSSGVLAAEAAHLCRATLQTTLPKLVPSDIAPFRSLLAAAFPEAGGAGIEAAALQHALIAVCAARSLTCFASAPPAVAAAQQAHLSSPQRTALQQASAAAAESAWPLFRPSSSASAAAGAEAFAEAEPPSPAGHASSLPPPLNDWASKVLQLYHSQVARHGVVLVGPPGAGKTAAWRTLLDAMALVDGARAEVHVVDAKALAGGKEQLYGRLDPATAEWTDGILPAVLRGVLANARGEEGRRHWLVFDGDVDPDWAEALNSVLDDNRLLTLPSGERLPLPPNVRIVLETDSLRWATMATVSRVGMVCFAPEAVSPAMVAARFVALLARGELPEAGPAAPSPAADRALVAPKLLAGSAHAGGGGGAAAAGISFKAEGDGLASEGPTAHLCRALAQGLRGDLCAPGGLLLGSLAAVARHVAPGAPGADICSPAGPIMPVSPAALVSSALSLVTTGVHALAAGLAARAASQPGYAAAAAAASDMPALVMRGRQWTALAVAWAMSGAFPAETRAGIAASVASLAAAAGIALPPGVASTGAAGGMARGASLAGSGEGGAALGLLDFDLSLATGAWQPWATLVPAADGYSGGGGGSAPSGLAASAGAAGESVIPTPDTARLGAQVRAWLACRKPIILCGPPGSGKTMILSAVLAAAAASGGPAGGLGGAAVCGVAHLSFSSASGPELLLRALEQHCEYGRSPSGGWVLRPPTPPPRASDDALGGSSAADDAAAPLPPWLVVFCDEINLPAQDRYGTQRLVAFMRGLVEQGGFWMPPAAARGGGSGGRAAGGAPGGRASIGGAGAGGASGGGGLARPPATASGVPVWVTVERVQFVGACNPPTDAGRVPLPGRLLRHAPVLFVGYPGHDSLLHIYGTLTRGLARTHAALRPFGGALAAACLEAYEVNSRHFRPETAPQYVYSPRELSRWVRALREGLARAPAGAFSPGLVARLWLHEGLRLFSDRLITASERAWCADALDAVARKHFGGTGLVGDIEAACARPVLFSDWGVPGGRYEPQAPAALRRFAEARLRTFNEEVQDAPLVLFDDALAHLLRIDRVLGQPMGHLLLAGASGCGKTVLTRFAAWMRGMPVHSVRLSPRYGLADFDADLRRVMRAAGVDGEGVVFLFDESNAVSSAFLERMNALLASGEVPGLFEGDARAELLSACRSAWAAAAAARASAAAATSGSGRGARRASTAPTLLTTWGDADVESGGGDDDGVWRRFTANVQAHLHVVFTLNPATAQFSARRATSPALFNRCVVDWFGDWSPAARLQVAAALTAHLDLNPKGGAGGAFKLPPSLVRSATAGGRALRESVAAAAIARVNHAQARAATAGTAPKGAPADPNAAAELQYRDAIVAAMAHAHAAVQVRVGGEAGRLALRDEGVPCGLYRCDASWCGGGSFPRASSYLLASTYRPSSQAGPPTTRHPPHSSPAGLAAAAVLALALASSLRSPRATSSTACATSARSLASGGRRSRRGRRTYASGCSDSPARRRP